MLIIGFGADHLLIDSIDFNFSFLVTTNHINLPDGLTIIGFQRPFTALTGFSSFFG